MFADLHIHSVHSDGSLLVEDIVFYAKRAGLEAIAITDHDTMAGVETAIREGEKVGIRVIPGVEITTRDGSTGRPVHLLCYYPKKHRVLQTFLETTLRNRTLQKLEMIKKVQKFYPVTLEHIRRYADHSEAIYECHIMQALADLGYTNLVIGPLMDSLLSPKGSCYAPSKYPDVLTALDMIRKAGGIAVLAHPGDFDSLGLLEKLASEKLIQGVEYSHPRNTPKDQNKILEIAKKYNLILTGGTDFHGLYSKKPNPIGSFCCPSDGVERLILLSSVY